MFVSDAPVGASFKILRVTFGKEVGRRLADMGFTEGAEGVVIRSGFLRGPLQVRIRGYDILIRRNEAAGIEIEPIGNWKPMGTRFRRGRFGNFGRHGMGIHGGVE